VSASDAGTTATGIARGADWLATRWRGCESIVIDGKAGAGALVDALLARGVPARWIVRPTADQVVTAHTNLLAAVHTGALIHTGQPGLVESVVHAARRPIGNAGGWGFAPVTSSADVTPIEAVVLALYGATTGKRKENRRPGASAQRPTTTRHDGRKAVLL
jgi:hypothetical protein